MTFALNQSSHDILYTALLPVRKIDTVKARFEEIVTKIINSHNEKEMEETWTPKITQITEKYLGKGKKASQCTRDQVEQLNLVVLDLEDLIK